MCDTENIYIKNLSAGGGGTTGRVVYSIINDLINVHNTTYEYIGRMAWDDSRYSGYLSGVAVFNVNLPGTNNLEVQVISPAGPPVLGSATITTSGTFNIPIILPTADSFIRICAKRTNTDLSIPQINGMSIEFTI